MDRIASPWYTMLLTQAHLGESLCTNLWRFGFSFFHFRTLLSLRDPTRTPQDPFPKVALAQQHPIPGISPSVVRNTHAIYSIVKDHKTLRIDNELEL